MAEFLAAQFRADQVANSGLPLGRVIALLCGSTPLPHASLRGVFSWLTSLFPAPAEELVTIDPYGIVSCGDPTCLPSAAKRALLEALRLPVQQEPVPRRELGRSEIWCACCSEIGSGINPDHK